MAAMDDEVCLRLLIHGRVQGVYFRASARDTAAELGLRGWVRNRPDGSVEAVAAGREDTLESFVAWCGRGPAAAKVTRVWVEPASGDELGADFEVRR